jgi:hypothetical protein
MLTLHNVYNCWNAMLHPVKIYNFYVSVKKKKKLPYNKSEGTKS